jgi:DNA-directed RNA polymerase subunit beta'
MADMALKTADSGYLTRRLVDVSQEVVVLEEDCHPAKGFLVSAIIDTKHNNTIVPLKDRLVGRHAFEDVFDDNNNLLVHQDQLITEAIADAIVGAGIQEVNIRSVLTCDAERGVCQKCYGINLATSEEVRIGEPVGVIAAQSVGEPGTQLTMRNFHTGGVAGDADITQGLPRIKELLDITTPKGALAIISKEEGTVTKINREEGIAEIIVTSINGDEKKYRTQFNAVLRVEEGDYVRIGQKLTEGSIDIKELLDIASVEAVENYILKEVQKVYRLQGIEISDKYIEIIIKQMLGKVKIIESGDSELLPGEIVSVKAFNDAVLVALENNKRPPLAKRVIFGIKKAPLESES